MTRRRRTAIQGPPLRLGDYDIPKSAKYGRPILCNKCGKGGGTLEKAGLNKEGRQLYEHAVCPEI